VAGLLAAMPETMLAFAPNYNSFRRFRPDAHAPTSAGWGIDDRSAAIRVIAGDAKATRIEHRISGADVNPMSPWPRCWARCCRGSRKA
jgi:glutamine synthetase